MAAALIVDDYIQLSTGWTKLISGLTGAMNFRAFRPTFKQEMLYPNGTIATNGTSSSSRTVALEDGSVAHINDGTLVLVCTDRDKHKHEWVAVEDLVAGTTYVVCQRDGNENIRVTPGTRNKLSTLFSYVKVVALTNVTSGGQVTKKLEIADANQHPACVIGGGMVIKLLVAP